MAKVPRQLTFWWQGTWRRSRESFRFCFMERAKASVALLLNFHGMGRSKVLIYEKPT
jgi:hypothetical protein